MARNPEKEQEQILNGNKFLGMNTEESTGVFLRDTDKLLHQYSNLRHSLFNQFKSYLPDSVTQEELKSYIDEQFVRLVKEYHINGAVDFPGYIKTKLTHRVRHSYIKGEYRDRKRVFVTKNDGDVTIIMDSNPSYDSELDYYMILEDVLKGVTMSQLEKEVLYLTMQEHTESQIVAELSCKWAEEGVSSTRIREVIKDIHEFIRTRLSDKG